MTDRLSAGSRVSAALFVAALVAGLLDPYSVGDEGGEFGLRSHSWQVAATALQTVLLAVAAYLSNSGARSRALTVATIEGTLFILLNVVYLLRDGTTRLAAGYTADTTVVLALAIGLVARGAAIGLLMRKAGSSTSTA